MIKGAIASLKPQYFVEKEYEDFFFPLAEKLQNLVLESGYYHLQATKPDTLGTQSRTIYIRQVDSFFYIFFFLVIGVALTNNPIGLAAYILEKFATWTHPEYKSLTDGGLDSRKDLQDALLDNIMIYYLTNSITTSMRIYAESLTRKQRAYQMERVPTNVPTGCARFKNDVVHSLDWQLKDKYPNLIHSTYYKTGGHFIAMEAPKILYDDFLTFVKKVEAFNKTNK